MSDADLLASCLAELDREGWDLDQVLARHPDLPESVQESLRAAAWLRRAPRVMPSATFRAQSRERLEALIRADAGRPASRVIRLHALLRPMLRPIAAPLAAALLLVFGVAGVWNASAALPDTPLYPAKLAIEQVRLLVAVTPQQKTEAYLSVAAERLQEASAEEQAGRGEVAHRLLASYDHAVAAAQTTGRGSAARPDDPVAQEVNRAVANLQTQRQQVTARTVAMAATAAPASPTAPRQEVAATATNAASDDRRTPEAREVARVVPAAASPTDSVALADVPTKAPARVSAAAITSATTAVPPASSVPPQAPAASTATPPTELTERLLRDLLNQVMAGNAPDAEALAQQYVAAVQAVRPTGPGGLDRLRGQRAQLVLALLRTPAATRPVVAEALSAVDAALSGTAGGSPATVTAQSSAADGTLTATAIPHGNGGNGNGNGPPGNTGNDHGQGGYSVHDRHGDGD